MKSLLPNQNVDDLTPEIAQKIMSLPKEIGVWEETKDSIIIDIGRPYESIVYFAYVETLIVNCRVKI